MTKEIAVKPTHWSSFPWVAVVLVCSLAGLSTAQQVGDSDRDYALNVTGSVMPSYVAHSLVAGAAPMANHYATATPQAPILWLFATGGTVGWVPGLTQNSVDIGPLGVQPVLDGWSSSSLSLFLRTGLDGNFDFNVVPDASLGGFGGFFGFAHATPSSADGFFVSQIHNVGFQSATNSTCSLGVSMTTAQSSVALGFNFTLYGVTRNLVWVSNRGVLGMSPSGLQIPPTTPIDFISAPGPLVAPLMGTHMVAPPGVTFSTDNVGHAEFCWQGTFSHGSPNSFRVAFDVPSNSLTMDFGFIGSNGTTFLDELLTGISPGPSGLLPPSVFSLDMSLASGAVLTPGAAYFEEFAPFPAGLPGTPPATLPPNPMDLSFLTITFVLDAGGYPIGVL